LAPQPLTKQEKRKKWLKWLAIGVLSFFAFILLMDLVIMPLYVKKGEVGTVPKVVGKQIDAAMETVEEAGFEPVKYEVQYDEKAKEGTIIRQTPEGGDEAKPGRKVYLIVSAGKEVVKVPSLVGLNLSDARIMLVRSNLSIGKTDYIFADSTPSGVVYSQYPKPGTSLLASKMVNLTVSQGPRTGRVAVPELIGLKLEEAILRITRLGLKPGIPNFNSRPEGAIGSVYDTYPIVGELVEFGSTIELFVVKDNAEPAEEIQEDGQ
jgi:beta-lactam-binding protein with PASTA domain